MLSTAVILAAGKGTRMWPFTEVRNKCAIPVANVPNVLLLARALHEIGVSRLVVIVGYQEQSVRHALRQIEPRPAFVVQEPNSGTAGAALAGLRLCSDERHVLLIYGDVVSTADVLADFVVAWEQSGASAGVLYDEVHPAESGDWYAVHVHGDRCVRIVGHEAGATHRWCGAAILPTNICEVLEANPGRMLSVPVGGMPPLEPDLAESINDLGAEIIAVPAQGFVVDMDKPWHILEANTRMAGHLCSSITADVIDATATVDDSAEVAGRLVIGPRSRIGKRVQIEGNVIVGPDTVITNGAILRGSNLVGDKTSIQDYCLIGANSVVGSGCVVGHCAEMDGVLMDGAYLYHYCEISGVVGLSVDIGAATVCGTLRFDDGIAEHRIRGRHERPLSDANGTFFGDYCRTGVNVITMPGTKIGAYSCVGGGIVVYEDLPSRTLLLLKQDTVARPWGSERYGW